VGLLMWRLDVRRATACVGAEETPATGALQAKRPFLKGGHFYTVCAAGHSSVQMHGCLDRGVRCGREAE
jgi:hypothetical protein